MSTNNTLKDNIPNEFRPSSALDRTPPSGELAGGSISRNLDSLDLDIGPNRNPATELDSNKRNLSDTSFIESDLASKRHTSSPIRLESLRVLFYRLSVRLNASRILVLFLIVPVFF